MCFEIIYPGLLTFIGVEVFEKFVLVEELVDCVALLRILLKAFIDEVLKTCRPTTWDRRSLSFDNMV